MAPRIDTLLQARESRRSGTPGNAATALGRLGLNRFLADNFPAFDRVRNHLFHRRNFPRLPQTAAVRRVLDRLQAQGWVVPPENGGGWSLTRAGHRHQGHLQGGWLEEYTFAAHREAGCDEAYYGQDIQWRVGETTGYNEIDVLARRGDTLSFTSCKCLHPRQRGLISRLREFLSEADYWDRHFAAGQGRVLLVTTTDVYDEMRQNAHRYPTLLARASILEANVLGLEDLAWPRLIDRIRAHWG